jgi:hypothetical protein
MSEIIKEIGDKKGMINALLSSEFYDVEFNRGEGVVEFTAHNELNEMLDITLVLDSDYFNKDYYYQPTNSCDPCDVKSKDNLNIQELDPDEVSEEWDNSDYVNSFYANIDKIVVVKNS